MSEVAYYEVYSTSPAGKDLVGLEPFKDLGSALEYVSSTYGSFNIVKVILVNGKIVATELVDTHLNIY